MNCFRFMFHPTRSSGQVEGSFDSPAKHFFLEVISLSQIR